MSYVGNVFGYLCLETFLLFSVGSIFSSVKIYGNDVCEIFSG